MIGKMYDKVGWLNNPVLNEEGCGRTGEHKLARMDEQSSVEDDRVLDL